MEVCPPHLRKETDTVSERLYSVMFRILDDGESPKTPVVLRISHSVPLINILICFFIYA
jgi:hypothetical protein